MQQSHARERHSGATTQKAPPSKTVFGSSDAARCEALDSELTSIASDQAVIDVRVARCLRAIDIDGTWRHFGFPTIFAYLEDRLDICPRTARDRLRVARELASLPLVEAALERGEISQSAVRELCRVADASTEAAWLARARGKNLRCVEDLVRGHRKGAHPDDDKRPDLEPRRITVELSPATYALYRQTLKALSDEIGRTVDEDEAIATMCRRTLEPAADEPTRARHQVAVTICESCQRGWQDGAGAVIEIEAPDVEVAMCDAEHIGSLDAAQPARARQDVSPATRRLVWRRDHGKCRVEGCRSARNLDVHHVVHRADGGGHDASNLVVMCSGCHAALHRGLIEVTGSAPMFVFEHRASVHSAAARTLSCSTPQPMQTGEENVSTASLGRASPSAVARTSSCSTAQPMQTGEADMSTASLRRDACEGLRASGYSKSEAAVAVDAALAELDANVSLATLLQAAFRRCRRS